MTGIVGDNGARRQADQALAVPVEPVARLDPTGFDPSRGFLLKSWDVTVHGYGTERIVATSRGKALAAAWRCDAFNYLSFGDFLKIASAWRAMLVPANFGEPILVAGRAAFRVGTYCSYVSFARPFSDVVLNSHPSDVTAIAMEARQGGDGETRLHPKDDSAGPQDIAQGSAHD